MKVAVLFSGGKDSCLALHKAAKYHKIVCIVTLIPENKESYMFHAVNIELTKMQAQAMEIPIIQRKTTGEKEKELKDLKRALDEAIERFAVQGIVTGTIRSIYQATRIQRICNELELICFNPLWLHNDIELLEQIVARGFNTIITGVFAYPLSDEFLGKRIDKNLIEELRVLKEKYRMNAAGEGGELETFVVDAPLFKKKIDIVRAETRYKNNAGVFEIREARLVEK